MASYHCRECESYTPEPGSCVICGASLGSYQRAVAAAAISTTMMGLLWLLISVNFGIQLTILAAIFGGVVSGCTSHFSGGRGFPYQLIATGFTVAGIVAFDSLAMILNFIAENELGMGIVTWDLFFEDFKFRMLNDPFTIIFYSLGIFGGFTIWR